MLIATVENAVAGEAFRPGDVLASRQGLTVEIGNTDAEGRLILADALALADEEAPDLVFDFATLTGAARVALGPDLPALFTEDDALAAEIAATGLAVNDPVWRLPLWAPYAALLDSKIADLNNVSSGPSPARSRRPVPAPLRPLGQGACPPRPLRLEPGHEAGPAGGRRGADRAPRLRAPEGALRGAERGPLGLVGRAHHPPCRSGAPGAAR